MAGAVPVGPYPRRPARSTCPGRPHERTCDQSPMEERAPAWVGFRVKYLLDTNVVSMLDPRRHAQAPALIDWLDWLDRNGASLFLSVMTIAEIEAGILKLRRQRKIERSDELENLVTAISTEFGD